MGALNLKILEVKKIGAENLKPGETLGEGGVAVDFVAFFYFAGGWGWVVGV